MNCSNSSVSSFSTAVSTRERLVVLDAGVLPVIVLHGILIRRIGRHPDRNVLGDQLVHAVGVGPRNVADTGAGSLGTRKIDSFSHSAWVHGSSDARKP